MQPASHYQTWSNWVKKNNTHTKKKKPTSFYNGLKILEPHRRRFSRFWLIPLVLIPAAARPVSPQGPWAPRMKMLLQWSNVTELTHQLEWVSHSGDQIKTKCKCNVNLDFYFIFFTHSIFPGQIVAIEALRQPSSFPSLCWTDRQRAGLQFCFYKKQKSSYRL